MDEVSFNLLRGAGFSEKEAKIYLACLQLGQATVSQIAENSKIKRPTAYLVLENLISQGYLNIIPNTNIRQYVAVDPHAILAELSSSAQDFKEMLPYLQHLQNKAAKPSVMYYNGQEGARRAFNQIKRPKEVRYAVSIKKIQQFLPDELQRWKTAYSKSKARAGGKHLLANTVEDKIYSEVIKKAGQLVKFINNENLPMDMVLFDNKVMFTAFDSTMQVTVIESESLYKSLCTLFDLAWQSAKSNVSKNR